STSASDAIDVGQNRGVAEAVQLAGPVASTELRVAVCGKGDRERPGPGERRAAIATSERASVLPRTEAAAAALNRTPCECRSTEARPALRSRHPLRPALLRARR